MTCDRVQHLLSEFLDDALDPQKAVQMTQHLGHCVHCREEFVRLFQLRDKLNSLRDLETPDCLRHLVALRISNMQKNSWPKLLRGAIEYRWSKLRTIEGMWYLSRALGTVMTSIVFMLISNAITPMYMDAHSPYAEQGVFSRAYGQRMTEDVLNNLGLAYAKSRVRHIGRRDAMINDLYFVNFGQRVSRSGKDDTFSVVTVVDSSGSAKVQDVLEYPRDQSLLSDFSDMIASARCRPGSENGHAVVSHLVLMFSRISVYD